MKKEQIDEVLNFPGFLVYVGERKDELLKILQETSLSITQLDLLFNSDSITGGIIADYVEESINQGDKADSAARWLGKFIWNIKEIKKEPFVPEPIIQPYIDRLGPCNEKEIEDIQKLITTYIAVHRGRIIQPRLILTHGFLARSSNSADSRIRPAGCYESDDYFIEETKNSLDYISALTLLRLAGIEKPENNKILKKHTQYLPSIIRVLDILSHLEILSQPNFDKLKQIIPPPDRDQQSLARLGFALDRLIKANLLTKENGQLYFEKIIENVTAPSGTEFLKLLHVYEKEIKKEIKSNSQMHPFGKPT